MASSMAGSYTAPEKSKTVLLGRKVQSRYKDYVKAHNDTETPRITGFTVMTNGDVVLCDYNNDKIKLLSSSRAVVRTGNVKLSSPPWDVSVIDPTSVIVTLPWAKQLQLALVYPQLKPGRVIQLDKQCWGVAVGKGELYVSCYNDTYHGVGEIRVLGLDFKVKRRLGVNQDGLFMFATPYYITMNSSGEKIFVSDWGNHTVTCMSVDGRVIYTYKDGSMRGPYGLLCDSEDNILVCGEDSHNVQVLTADGKWHFNVLTASDGLEWPRCIAYRDSDNTLLVGCYKSGHLLSFKLQIMASSKTVLLSRKVQSRSQVNVKAGDDKKTPDITGCIVMTNGDVVLCDWYNDKIKLLNSSGVLTGNVELSSRPWDVSVLYQTSVIVTLPFSGQLQVVQVYPQLKPWRVIQLNKWCRGVAVGKGELYVTCHNPFGPGNGEIRVLDLDGKVKRRLGVNQDGSFMFIWPTYITVNSSGEKIFVSDWSTDTVTCMSVDGRVIYTYKDGSMRGPKGLLCDSEDNILVCGEGTNNVQVLTADGKRHCTLLTESDGLEYPHSIAYRDSDNTLLVGCRDSDHLLSFQLTK